MVGLMGWWGGGVAFRLEGMERSSFPELHDELQELVSPAQVCIPVESGSGLWNKSFRKLGPVIWKQT